MDDKIKDKIDIETDPDEVCSVCGATSTSIQTTSMGPECVPLKDQLIICVCSTCGMDWEKQHARL
ncbi:MAG: hypothetical protein KAR42_16210 [candidate division Zixibacteria bacterium]|nr:hypothetical protein [candidate division Zixibacteria bacterium]